MTGGSTGASAHIAAASANTSPSGTTIPSATQITDSSGNVWTVSSGAIYENGSHAGSSANTALLLYYNGVIYTQNNQGNWWSWNGSTFVGVSGDPRGGSASASGTTIPAATQIIDGSGNVWTVSGGAIYENGTHAGSSANTALLLYYNGVIYTQNNQGSWWSWNGSTFVGASGDPRGSAPSGTGVAASASGTTIPSATQIVDSSGNVWTVSGGAIYENGNHAGSSANTALLLYYNSVIYTQNNQGNWWSWNGSTFAGVSGDPRGVSGSGAASSGTSASASGTTIPSASQIVDSAGNVWTVSGGAIYENGNHAGSSANTALLLYYNGVIYTQNNQGNWWSWSGSTFVGAGGDPRGSGSGSAGSTGSTSASTGSSTPAPTGSSPSASTGSGSWSYALDAAHDALGLVAAGDAAYLVGTPTGSATPYAFAVYDENGNVVENLQPVAQANGTYTYSLPTSRYGYFEIRPTQGNAATLIPAVGSRPAGVLTYAVLPPPDTNPSSGFQDDYASIEGATMETGANALGNGTFPWLAYTTTGIDYYSFARCEPTQATAASDCARAMANDPYPALFQGSNTFPQFNLNGIPAWAGNDYSVSGPWGVYLDYIIPQIVQKYSFLPYRRYQITWEPNISWTGTDAQLVQLYQTAYSEIHKYDPHAIVVGPAIAQFGQWIGTFQNYLSLGLGNYLDAVSWHPYPVLSQIFPPAQNDASIAQVRTLAANAKGHTIPFYDTESGISAYELAYLPSYTPGASVPQNNYNSGTNISAGNYGVWHAAANVAEALLEKNDGASLHTYFYTADWGSDSVGLEGYGLFYNATPAYGFGPGKVSPKVDVPMIRQANEILNHSNAVGRLSSPGGNANLVVLYYQNKHTGVYTVALMDPTGNNGTIALQTGAAQVTVLDAFGNATPMTTANGTLNLTLGIEPRYVQGIAASALSGITPAAATGF